MDKLKPCPFCGGEASIQAFNITPKVKGRIICSCGAEMRVGENKTIDDIAIAWDARVESIVRCMDCKRYHPKEGAMLSCHFEYKYFTQWRSAEPDGYCAWAVRKEGE